MIFVVVEEVVPESQQAVIVRTGKPVRVANQFAPDEAYGQTGAGIIPRIPVFEQVQYVDKRVLDLDMERQQVLSNDQQRLQVDAYARFRIIDPVRMVETAGTEDNVALQLQPILTSVLRQELGRRSFASLLTPERGTAMGNIRDALDRQARQYGAQVIDVRIKRADLPEGTPAYGKDPQFYDFYRAMESYRRTFQTGSGESAVVLSPDNEYLRQFRGR